MALTDEDPTIASLRNVLSLEGVTDTDLARIAALIDDLAVPAGTVLMREGRPGQDCFLILSGEAEVVIDGRVVATVGAGQFIGEMALLSGRPRSATVTAITKMQLFTISVNAFVTLLADSDVAKALLQTMATQLQSARSPETADSPERASLAE